MGSNARSSRKSDKKPGSSKNSSGGKKVSSGLGSCSGCRSSSRNQDSSGLRRSMRRMLSRNQDNLSSVNVRKSPRMQTQTLPTTPSAQNKSGNRNSSNKSECENKDQSWNSRMLGKGSIIKGVMKQLKGHNSSDAEGKMKNETLKELGAKVEGKGATNKPGKPSLEVCTKRKTRSDAHKDMKMSKPLKKKTRVSDSANKTARGNQDRAGDNGSDAKVPEECCDGVELKEDCGHNIDGEAGVSAYDLKKHVDSKKPNPCKSAEGRFMQISDAGNPPSSCRIEIMNENANSMEADCFMMGKNIKIQSHKEHFSPIQLSNDDNSRCNMKGTIPIRSEGSHAVSEYNCLSESNACKRSFLIGKCDNCDRKGRLDYNSPEQELCCCLSSTKNDVDVILVAKDRGVCETCVTPESSAKCVQDMQQSDCLLHVEQNTYAKHPGNLLYCGGKGCKRSCPSSAKVDKLLLSWYCSRCITNKVRFGVHSVTEGIESIWDVREVRVSNSKGEEHQKQFFVKYKGLSHIHNHWVPETQLIYEVPELLAKFSESKEDKWKPEWAVPHRLFQKRSIIVDDISVTHDDVYAGNLLDGQCEWLVKWSGLDYDQATWELEGSSCFKSPAAQQLIHDYETHHARARKLPLSRGDEIREIRKASCVKLGKLPGGVLSAADSCYLNCVNKLREYHRKGHNGVLIDEQDRFPKVIYLILSLILDVQKPFLIITQHASAWEMEFRRIDSSVNVVLYSGSTNARRIARSLEFFEEGGNMMLQLLLSSVEVLSEDLEELKAIDWEAIIVDDCQQSCISAHSVAINSLATGWRLCLLNAELEDNVAEYVNILSFLEPGASSNQNLGSSIKSCRSINMWKEKLSSYIVCPRFLEYWVPVQISNLQIEQYCSLILTNSTSLHSLSKTDAVGSLHELLKSLQKCCGHPYVVEPSLQSFLADGLPPDSLLDLGIRASGKLTLLDKILSVLRNQELKVLILYQSIGGCGRDITGDILDDFLHYRYGSDSYEHVNGISSKKQAALDKFNRERERSFFLLETRACLSSIKLSTVDAVVIFGSDWNPNNDLRALQKIFIDSKLERIKVFRLYCPYTVEEKVLVLAKNNLILDSALQGISKNTSHMLLMWGSSYLFAKLDEFHHQNVPDCRDDIVPGNSFLMDVCEEVFSLFQNFKTPKSNKFISVAKQIGGSYIKNTSLIGEMKIPNEDGVLPHAFWTNLLEGKQPHWKYVSGTIQRNRKRAHHFDVRPMTLEVPTDGAAKRQGKIDCAKADTSPTTRQNDDEKSKAAKDCMAENGEETMANKTHSLANIYSTLQKSSDPSTQCMSKDIPGARNVLMNSEQNKLFQMLTPTINKLCKILLFKNDGKLLAEQFLEYIIKNHRVAREPETMLQAFGISVCWSVAAVLNQHIDHKTSLATAREELNFSCSEDDADFMYSKLKFLKEMFLRHSKVFRSPSNIPSATKGITRDLKEITGMPEESLPHKESFDEETLNQLHTTNNKSNTLIHIRKIEKNCDKLMKRLKNKQNEELEENRKRWVEQRADLEKEYRKELAISHYILDKSSVGKDKLKILDITYTKKREDLESQILNQRKELELKQQSEIDELQRKTTQWIKQVKSLSQVDLSNKPSSVNGQLPVSEHVEPYKHSIATASISGELLQQSSDCGTSDFWGTDIALTVSKIPKIQEKPVTLDVHSAMLESQMLISQDDAITNITEAVLLQKEVEPDNSDAAGPTKQPPSASTGEMDKDTPKISIVEFSRSIDHEVNQVNEARISPLCVSTESLSSPGITLMEQPDTDLASIGRLSFGQWLEDEPCQRLARIEKQVGHISESLSSDSCVASGTIPSHDYHEARDASRCRQNIEPCEVHTSNVMTVKHEDYYANVSVEAGSWPLPELAVNHAVDANICQIENCPSTIRNGLLECLNHPNTLQVPTFTNSQLPSLCSDPLENESQRICREIDEMDKVHEGMKLRLKSECDKEIEEIIAKIRMKYDGKQKEADTAYSLQRDELKMYRDKVLKHKFLAEAFKSECWGTKALYERQKGIFPRSLAYISQSPATRPSSINASFSGSQSLSIPSNATSSVRHWLVSKPTTQTLPINSYAPTRALEQVRNATYASGPHLQLRPFVSCSVMDQQAQQSPIDALGSSSTPVQSRQPLSPPIQAFPTSNGHSQLALNYSTSAMELLMEIGRQNNAHLAKKFSS